MYFDLEFLLRICVFSVFFQQIGQGIQEWTKQNLRGTDHSRPYDFKFFKDCLPQIFLGPFLNTLTQIIPKKKFKKRKKSFITNSVQLLPPYIVGNEIVFQVEQTEIDKSKPRRVSPTLVIYITQISRRIFYGDSLKCFKLI